MSKAINRVDIDALTERLSLQDFRSARPLLYAALRELAELRTHLAEILAAYTEYIDTDLLDPLAEAVGRAREVLDLR